MASIIFDRDKREELRKAYDAARAQGKDEFMFEGKLFLTDYAKYVLEFLATRLGP